MTNFYCWKSWFFKLFVLSQIIIVTVVTQLSITPPPPPPPLYIYKCPVRVSNAFFRGDGTSKDTLSLLHGLTAFECRHLTNLKWQGLRSHGEIVEIHPVPCKRNLVPRAFPFRKLKVSFFNGTNFNQSQLRIWIREFVFLITMKLAGSKQ